MFQGVKNFNERNEIFKQQKSVKLYNIVGYPKKLTVF